MNENKTPWKFQVKRDRDGWVSSKHRTERAAMIEAARVSKLFAKRGETYTVEPMP